MKLSRVLSALRGIPDTIREERWLQQIRTIRPTDFVLDIGSGGNPDLRANVLCDKFLSDGAERHGTPVVVDRPFVAGDVERLPFRDGSFDYVILSHVLEHLPDPERAISELQRVARRGYIETPGAVFERLYGYPFHRWMVSVQDDTLVLEAKTKALCDPELRDWFDRMHATLGTGGKFWAQRRRLDMYTCYEWEGEIRFRLDRPSGSFPGADDPEGLIQGRVDEAEPAPVRLAGDGGPLWHTQQWFSRRARRHSDRPWSAVEALLCCPTCRGELDQLDPSTVRCTACLGAYPVHPCGVPLLLAECRQPHLHATHAR